MSDYDRSQGQQEEPKRLCGKIVLIRLKRVLTGYAPFLLRTLVKRSQTTLHTASKETEPVIELRWGDPISDRRKRELVALERKWERESDHSERLSAFTWVQLTGADAFWLAARARVAPGGDIAAAERELRSARTEGRSRSLGIPPLNLGGADLSQAHLEEASLHHTDLKGVYFGWAHLEKADLYQAHLEGANFIGAYLKETIFEEAHLEDADLSRAHLEGAIFEEEAHLERAFLDGVHLEGADLSKAHLEDTHLRGAFFNAATILPHRFWANKQHVGPWLADVHWGDVNLTVVDWEPVAVLADEDEARQLKRRSGGQKGEDTQLDKYQAAVRANRLLAVALLEQGLNEHAAHFAYHAQILQRKVLGLQLRRERKGLKLSGKLGQYLFSWFLCLLGGYGYRMWRIFSAYAIVVALFALAYFILGAQGYGPHLRGDEAFLVSITAFHGRVFAEQFGFATPQMWFTAGEAVLGLLIESVFIAMLVQRFFGK